jgi:hypothetical protein
LKTAGFMESPVDTMFQQTVISLYTNRVFLPHKMIFSIECCRKAIPIIGGNTSAGYFQIRHFFLQFPGCFQVPFAPNKGYNFTCCSMISIAILFCFSCRHKSKVRPSPNSHNIVVWTESDAGNRLIPTIPFDADFLNRCNIPDSNTAYKHH